MAQDPRYNRSYQAPYDSDYASYDNQYAEPVDLDAFGSQLRSQHPSRSVATREEFLPDDSVPLFLSGADDDVRSSKFGRQRKNGSRVLKIGAFAAAALIATFVAVKNPFTVFANATASLMGSSEVRSAQAPAAPPRPAGPAAVASTPAMVAGPALATAAALPSRDEIAVALRTAHQNQAPEVQQPAAAVVATAAAPTVAMTPPVAPATPPAPAARRMDGDEFRQQLGRHPAGLALPPRMHAPLPVAHGQYQVGDPRPPRGRSARQQEINALKGYAPAGVDVDDPAAREIIHAASSKPTRTPRASRSRREATSY